MNEVKAFIHRSRAADVVRALLRGGFTTLSLVDVKGTLDALGNQELEFSMEFGRKVVTEVKLELVCEAAETSTAVDLIRTHAKTDQETSGYIYVSEVSEVISI